jgi:hypothetical protein
LFIDVTFTIRTEVHSAHRLVLSQRSGYFKRAFDRRLIPLEGTEIVIPFTGCDFFPQLIDFLYSGKLEVPSCNSQSLINFYALAAFYDIPDANAMLTDSICQRFMGSGPTAHVFRATSVYRDFEITYDPTKDPPELSQLVSESLARLKNSQSIFTDYLSRHFPIQRGSDRSQLYKSVTPFLFGLYLEEELPLRELSAVQIAKEVDTFTHFCSITDLEDRDHIISLVDWNCPDISPLFLTCEMKWVPPSISRWQFSNLLTGRRNTLDSLENSMGSFPGAMSRWFGIHWLEAIRAGTGESAPLDIELIHFLGTIGESTSPLHLCNLNFITTDSSRSLGSARFGARALFDGSRFDPRIARFIGHPEVEQPFIDIKFTRFEFLPVKVIIGLPSDRRDGGVSLKFTVRGFRESVMEFDAAQVSGESDVIEIDVGSDVKPVSWIRIEMEPVFLPRGAKVAVMRLSSIRVYGKFGEAEGTVFD